jgi:hypothetical protein
MDRGFDRERRARNPHWLRPAAQAYRVSFVHPRYLAGENRQPVFATGSVKSAEICSRRTNLKRVGRPIRFFVIDPRFRLAIRLIAFPAIVAAHIAY